MKKSLRFALFLILLLFTFVIVPLEAQEVEYFPTDGWRVSTPEEQGMDSAQLARMLNFLLNQENGPNIHNVLVIRNGYIVLDASVPPYSTESPHALYSATKAVVSTLAGVAQQQGYIQDYNQSVWDFLDATDYTNMDAAKQAMTLADLMTQRSGLGLNAGVGVPFEDADDVRMYEMREPNADWLQFVLDFPMDSQPGELYRYTDSNPYVLSGIIREATGQPVEQFAEEALFTPLGIDEYIWAISPQGIAWGGDGMLLSPQSLAKIGYLYMNDGQWDGQQILSPAWIEAAWTGYFRPHYLDGYGFYWYLDEAAGGHAAIGLEGQFLWVYPEQNLIVVTNGDIGYVSKMLLDMYILRAIVSDDPIPISEGTEQFATALETFTNPVQLEPTPMSAFAEELNGKVYGLPENGWSWETLALNFGDDVTTLTIFQRGEEITLPIGLDGHYALSDVGWSVDDVWQYVPDVPLATRGWWTGENTFTVRIRSTYGLQEYELTWVKINDTLRFSAMEMGVGNILYRDSNSPTIELHEIN